MSTDDAFEARRLSAAARADFLRIHDDEHDAGWCHCVAWWVETWNGWGDRTADQNRALRGDLFARGEYDGYLLYERGDPIGWCQVGPRDRLRKLALQMRLESDPFTWAITCFVVVPSARRRGVATRLLSEVLRDLPSRGARRVEAYTRRSADEEAELWNGPEAMFRAAGFELVEDLEPRAVFALELA